DGLDGAMHLAHLVAGHEHRRRREQVGMGGLDAQPPSQLVEIRQRAITFPVESFRGVHAVALRSNTCSSHAPATPPTAWAAMKPGVSAGRMPANVSLSARPMLMAGFANDVDAVNQYAAPIHNDTRQAACSKVGERNATSTSPAVATLSESHWPMPLRACVEACMAGRSNITFASMAPAQQPTICATTY